MCWLLHVLLQQRKHSLKDKHKNKRTYSIYTAGLDWTGPDRRQNRLSGCHRRTNQTDLWINGSISCFKSTGGLFLFSINDELI